MKNFTQVLPTIWYTQGLMGRNSRYQGVGAVYDIRGLELCTSTDEYVTAASHTNDTRMD